MTSARKEVSFSRADCFSSPSKKIFLFPIPTLTILLNRCNFVALKNTGASPSGKASAFGADIRRFESCRPSLTPLSAEITYNRYVSKKD